MPLSRMMPSTVAAFRISRTFTVASSGLPVPLCHVRGFPSLGLLRGLRHLRTRVPEAIPWFNRVYVLAWCRLPVRSLNGNISHRYQFRGLSREAFNPLAELPVGCFNLQAELVPVADAFPVSRDSTSWNWALSSVALTLPCGSCRTVLATPLIPSCFPAMLLSPLPFDFR